MDSKGARMSQPVRYIIEGEWSGYSSGQRRIVHRSVHQGAFKKLRSWVEKVGYIRYTDGTHLSLSVRDCEPRERVKELHGYDTLIQDCAFYDCHSVAGLREKRIAIKSSAQAPA